ncbi:MAG: Hsp20/alpha crystallin family protein [Gammaproteobacteria bacterium]|nr:Hsp20/alpha crystallin family protein [Gammaproteobacteria bacterium]
MMNNLIRATRAPVARRWNDDFDNMLEGFFRPMRWMEEEASQGLMPRIDVVERDQEFLVKAELPGIKKEDIDVSLENGVLTITAESKSESEEKEGDRVIRQERRYGKYVRSLRLGKEVDDKKVKANYKDGILELTLPKAEEVKPKKINVSLS